MSNRNDSVLASVSSVTIVVYLVRFNARFNAKTSVEFMYDCYLLCRKTVHFTEPISMLYALVFVAFQHFFA